MHLGLERQVPERLQRLERQALDMPVSMQRVETALLQGGIGLIPVRDADGAVARTAAMPDAGTIHIDIDEGRRLEARIPHMANGDLGPVEIACTVLAVAGG